MFPTIQKSQAIQTKNGKRGCAANFASNCERGACNIVMFVMFATFKSFLLCKNTTFLDNRAFADGSISCHRGGHVVAYVFVGWFGLKKTAEQIFT